MTSQSAPRRRPAPVHTTAAKAPLTAASMRRYMGCQPVDIGHAAQPQDECRIEASANTLTRDLKLFLNSSGEAARRAGGNMTVPVPRNCQTAQARAAERAMAAAREEIQNTEQHLLVDEADRRRKNVDSGKVAIIFTSDGMGSFYEKWACTSKERRRWAAETIQSDKRLGAKVIFIEVIVNSAKLMEQNLLSKVTSSHAPPRARTARPERVRPHLGLSAAPPAPSSPAHFHAADLDSTPTRSCPRPSADPA